MSSTPVEIGTAALADIANDGQACIVDLRPVEAFNGWALAGERRGGHIAGAMSFPFDWTRYKFEIKEQLLSKGITANRTVVVYGYDDGQIDAMAGMLAGGAYDDVRCYRGFVDEWSADGRLPMHRLARWDRLVRPAWLSERLEAGPSGDGHRPVVVCHCHYDHVADYQKGHVPGAIALDTNALESPRTWNRRTGDALRRTLEAHGITRQTTVVVYGRFAFPDNADPHPGKSAGHLGAIRCGAIMLWAGVEDVRVLNGGMNRWEDHGLPVSTEATEPTPAADFGGTIPGRPGLFVDTPEARRLLAASDGELVSVRSWPEFVGKVSGYHYIHKKGRIPGAVFGNCGSDAYHMENYRNLDYTTRDYHQIAAAWAEAGITPDKHIAFYCGTGWRGSEAFLNAWLMGWPRVSIYDGGWFEWSNDPANPIATGEPTGGQRAVSVGGASAPA